MKLTLLVIGLFLPVLFSNVNEYNPRAHKSGVVKKAEPSKPKIDLAELRCLAHNIYYEARSEPIEGQIAVAHVTLNRVKSPGFPSSICEVVKERRANTCQFSWWCDSRLRQQSLSHKIPDYESYQKIKKLAIDLLLKQKKDITDGALFYHATYVDRRKLGRMKLEQTKQYGKHKFYRIKS